MRLGSVHWRLRSSRERGARTAERRGSTRSTGHPRASSSFLMLAWIVSFEHDPSPPHLGRDLAQLRLLERIAAGLALLEALDRVELLLERPPLLVLGRERRLDGRGGRGVRDRRRGADRLLLAALLRRRRLVRRRRQARHSSLRGPLRRARRSGRCRRRRRPVDAVGERRVHVRRSALVLALERERRRGPSRAGWPIRADRFRWRISMKSLIATHEQP